MTNEVKNLEIPNVMHQRKYLVDLPSNLTSLNFVRLEFSQR
jgi:hypothetical protein